jgi:hypothetical protein
MRRLLRVIVLIFQFLIQKQEEEELVKGVAQTLDTAMSIKR